MEVETQPRRKKNSRPTVSATTASSAASPGSSRCSATAGRPLLSSLALRHRLLLQTKQKIFRLRVKNLTTSTSKFILVFCLDSKLSKHDILQLFFPACTECICSSVSFFGHSDDIELGDDESNQNGIVTAPLPPLKKKRNTPIQRRL